MNPIRGPSLNRIEDYLRTYQESHPHLASKISIFGRGLDALNTSFHRLDVLSLVRQQSIDFQVANECFDGDFHDQYHDISRQLDAEFDVFFSSIKTTLNRLPVLVIEKLSHSDQTGLRPKSFGAFLLSLSTKDFEGEKARRIKDIFNISGAKIDQSIHEYRDKSVEHIRDYRPQGLSSDPLLGISRYHLKQDLPSPSEPTLMGKLKGHQTPYLKLWPKDGGYVYFVHLKGIKAGQIQEGDLMGRVDDGGTGHFEKYGPHRHEFSSTGINPLKWIDHTSSPYSRSTYEEVLCFIQDVCEVLE